MDRPPRPAQSASTPSRTPAQRRRRAEVVILSPPPTGHSPAPAGPLRPVSPPLRLPPTPPARNSTPPYFDLLPHPDPGPGFARPAVSRRPSESDWSSAHSHAASDAAGDSNSEQGALFITSLQTGQRSRRRRRGTSLAHAAPEGPQTPSAVTGLSPSGPFPSYYPGSAAAAGPADVPWEAAERSGGPFRSLASQWPSLRRRRLDSNDANTDWRHAFIQQMHTEFDAGVDRARIFNRVAQRTVELAATISTDPPPPESARRNLVGTLRNVRAQRQAIAGLTRPPESPPSRIHSPRSIRLVYCGAELEPNNAPLVLPKGFRFTSPLPEFGSSGLPTRGCGRLICVRAAMPRLPPTRPPPRADSQQSLTHLVLSSNVCPVPQAVGVVDSASRVEFETNPSNPFRNYHRLSSGRQVCYCTKEYIGCLTCGHIVGHWLKSACFYCKQSIGEGQRFIYYNSRITSIPREECCPIPLGLPFEEYNGEAMPADWRQDVRGGYIGDDEDWQMADWPDEQVPSTSNTMSQAMRSTQVDQRRRQQTAFRPSGPPRASHSRHRSTTAAPELGSSSLTRSGAVRIRNTQSADDARTNLVNPRADSLDIDGAPIRDSGRRGLGGGNDATVAEQILPGFVAHDNADWWHLMQVAESQNLYFQASLTAQPPLSQEEMRQLDLAYSGRSRPTSSDVENAVDSVIEEFGRSTTFEFASLYDPSPPVLSQSQSFGGVDGGANSIGDPGISRRDEFSAAQRRQISVLRQEGERLLSALRQSVDDGESTDREARAHSASGRATEDRVFGRRQTVEAFDRRYPLVAGRPQLSALRQSSGSGAEVRTVPVERDGGTRNGGETEELLVDESGQIGLGTQSRADVARRNAEEPQRRRQRNDIARQHLAALRQSSIVGAGPGSGGGIEDDDGLTGDLEDCLGLRRRRQEENGEDCEDDEACSDGDEEGRRRARRRRIGGRPDGGQVQQFVWSGEVCAR